jgi:cytochrome c biogenesis protein CcmG/thiol:disulfide interchange protein DsbE
VDHQGLKHQRQRRVSPIGKHVSVPLSSSRGPYIARPRLALALCALAAALLLGACGSGDDGAGNPDSQLSEQQATAPLKDAPPALAAIRDQANRLLEGGTDAFEARLDELRGTPVVVNKWASWCGPCRHEFPFFQAQAVAHAKQVAFLGVDSDDSEAAAKTFLGELPLPYPSYLDPDADIAAVIKAPAAFPATAFYDASGELVHTKQGLYTDEAELAADIDRYTG